MFGFVQNGGLNRVSGGLCVRGKSLFFRFLFCNIVSVVRRRVFFSVAGVRDFSFLFLKRGFKSVCSKKKK